MTHFPQSTFDRPVVYPPAASQAPAPSPVKAPEKSPLLQIAQKVSKYILAALLCVIGGGSLGVGITLMPFSPQTGVAALALSTAAFSAAGCLFYGATSTS